MWQSIQPHQWCFVQTTPALPIIHSVYQQGPQLVFLAIHSAKMDHAKAIALKWASPYAKNQPKLSVLIVEFAKTHLTSARLPKYVLSAHLSYVGIALVQQPLTTVHLILLLITAKTVEPFVLMAVALSIVTAVLLPSRVLKTWRNAQMPDALPMWVTASLLTNAQGLNVQAGSAWTAYPNVQLRSSAQVTYLTSVKINNVLLPLQNALAYPQYCMP
jgi:hypothetical protein